MKNLTRQSLSDDELLYLIGVSQWVFNSNLHFIIEMIDKEHHNNSEESWFDLIELTAGKLKGDHKDLILSVLGSEIYDLFADIKEKRDAIVHSFPTGKKVDGYCIPVYRNDTKGKRVEIDKEYLKEFIKQNEKLSSLVYKIRGR